LLEALVAQALDVFDGDVGVDQHVIALCALSLFPLRLGFDDFALFAREPGLIALDGLDHRAVSTDHIGVESIARRRFGIPEMHLALRIPATIEGHVLRGFLLLLGRQRRACARYCGGEQGYSPYILQSRPQP
jgi:hypothetical protein